MTIEQRLAAASLEGDKPVALGEVPAELAWILQDALNAYQPSRNQFASPEMFKTFERDKNLLACHLSVMCALADQPARDPEPEVEKYQGPRLPRRSIPLLTRRRAT